MGKKGIRSVAAAALVVIALGAFAAPALGQDSTVDGYGGVGGVTENVVAASTEGEAAAGRGDATATADARTLPFTGLDIALMAGGALLLLGVGFAMSRLVVRQGEAA